MILKRHPENPIITPADIPELKPLLVDVSSVFNPGAVRFGDKYLLLLRAQNRGRETYLLRALSDDGVHFEINPEPIVFKGIVNVAENIYHVYDPRVTCIGHTYYIMVALDMDSCCRLGLARTDDFEHFEFLGIVSKNDCRNGVLFPERIDGRYLRLDRPNRVRLESGATTGTVIEISQSKDLIHWTSLGTVMEGRLHFWDELIGAGPPPVKTEKGWLLIYHGVATHLNGHLYQVGVALLDLAQPQTVLARGRFNILEPRELYEQVGQVPNVIFPSGMIVEHSDERGFAKMESKVLLYYGAADTWVCLATSTLAQLVAACYEGNP